MSGEEPSATEAFEQLRSEVALLRRAIEGLSAAAIETAAPDYSPTLAGLRKAIDGVSERIDSLVADPPVTSNQLAAGIAAVAAHARNEGQRDFAHAKGALEKGVRDLAQAAGAVRTARVDRRKVIAVGVAGVAVGIGLWTALSGPIARSLPEAWQAPERMAAASLDLSRWDAGGRLMARADASAWGDLVEARTLVRANASAIQECRKNSERRGRATTCEIVVPEA